MGLERSNVSTHIDGGVTFQHVFGVNQSGIEYLILHHNLMGPSWLKLNKPVSLEKKNISHCRFEATLDLDKGSSLSHLPKERRTTPPTISVLSLSLKTVVDPATHQHEVVCATGIIYEKVGGDNIIE